VSTRGITERVAVAKAGIENLRPAEVAAELADGDVVLVDVRGTDETAAGVIAGAIVVPRGLLEFYADPTAAGHLPPMVQQQRVIVYCATGARSALAVPVLHALGYTDVAHLDGGLAAWLADGRPTETPTA
jgi:rhodanese-related sulfurtransferase